ncbi:Bacterioopsin transcriptional activator [uncultured archaeon]|nr:Bacterioopsin transcriptional activator [uncultured archaeon]
MRKLTVELTPNAEFKSMKTGPFKLFNKVKSIEILQFVNIDFDRGVRLFIGLFTFKDGFSLHDVENPGEIEMLDIIKIKGNECTCFAKGKPTQEVININQKLGRDLIWDTPTIITEDKLVISVVGDKDNLKRFLEVINTYGKIENIQCQLSTYQGHNILSCLTDRQREVVLEAKRNGYYEYPRRINGDQLAQKVGISKAVAIEHLRKAEARIMSNILSGY